MAIKVDIISGFLGAGKTELIKKFVDDVWPRENIVVLENDFGEINIDAEFLKGKPLRVESLVSGCICCSLVGDFRSMLLKITAEHDFDRVIIEPSGLSKLSQIVEMVRALELESKITLELVITVVDVTMVHDYLALFGEFYGNQIENADALVYSRSQEVDAAANESVAARLREMNESAVIVTTPWDEVSGKVIFNAAKSGNADFSVRTGISDDENHDHGHHHLDRTGAAFESWSFTTTAWYTVNHLRQIAAGLTNDNTYGRVLRAKGVVQTGLNAWLAFNFEPKQFEIVCADATDIGRVSVIGTQLRQDDLQLLFQRKSAANQ